LERKKIQFDIERFEIDDSERKDSQFLTAKILLFSSGQNLHAMTCSSTVLKKTAKTIYNKPILYSINKFRDDLASHSDPSDTLIAGYIVPNSEVFVESDSGRTELFVNGAIWKKYALKFVEILQKSSGIKKNSVEMDLLDYKELPDGTIEMLDWEYFGTCILGDDITEASPGSHLEVLSFAEENKAVADAYNLEFGNYDDVDLSIPDEVKKNIQKGLDLYKQHNKGGNSIALASARYLLKNEKVNSERIKHVAKVHKSNKFGNMKKSPPSSEYINWMLYGGAEGKNWAEDIVKQFDEIDSKHISYFDEIINFPYKTLKDVNPAIRGIDPKVSLEQANQIVKVAERIGVTEEKNGYAIAISQFKKTHVIKDEKWVKKENMEEENEFAKEDLGKGESISVNKNKDSMSDEAWGNVDKTSLQHKVLSARNYKSLVNDVYLLVEDGWEEHPSSSLKYPVMCIKDGKLVYNRDALSAALGRAKGQNETSVISKLNGLYKKLGLNSEKEENENMSADEEFSLTSSQMIDILNNSLSDYKYGENNYNRFWISDFDDVFVYIRDCLEDKLYRAKYEINNLVGEIDVDEREEVIRSGFEPVGSKGGIDMADKENIEEKDKKEIVTKENKEQKMSNDSNLDVAAILAFLEDETESYKKVVEEEFAKPQDQFNYATVISALMSKAAKQKESMCKMEEQNKTYMEENEQLKQFKAEMDNKEKDFAVKSTLKEVEACLSSEKVAELTEDSKNFSLENLNIWQNKVRSAGFEAIKDKKQDNVNQDIVRLGLPFHGVTKDKSGSLWG
jgi:hypothetical protein